MNIVSCVSSLVPPPFRTSAFTHFPAQISSEPILEAANYTTTEDPSYVDEWILSGLTPVPSKTVAPPRVGESPFAMECTLSHSWPLKRDDSDDETGMVVVSNLSF